MPRTISVTELNDIEEHASAAGKALMDAVDGDHCAFAVGLAILLCIMLQSDGEACAMTISKCLATADLPWRLVPVSS
jgi:hypothetical protein